MASLEWFVTFVRSGRIGGSGSDLSQASRMMGKRWKGTMELLVLVVGVDAFRQSKSTETRPTEAKFD